MSTKIVPNEHPSIKTDECIAIVGEAPGKDETDVGRPFVGASGQLLSQVMNANGILRSTCLMANICQVQPPKNNIYAFSWQSWQIQEGLRQLSQDIKKADPSLVVLLGETALKAAGEKREIINMRGTKFLCQDLDSPFYGRKCLATLHPASIMRKYDWLPLMNFDLSKATVERKTRELVLPNRLFDLDLSVDEICEKLYNWPLHHPAAFDIEGGVSDEYPGITCLSIADSPSYAFIIDVKNCPNHDKPKLWDALHWWLRNPDIPKIAQNLMYENFCIPWKWKIPINGLYWDTMLSGWELYPELPKALETQVSIYTDEPYYKDERKILDDRTHHIYCCKDSTCTYEIYEKHKAHLDTVPEERKHFQTNMRLLPSICYIQLRGMLIDSERVQSHLNEIKVEQDVYQARIDVLNNGPLNCNSSQQLCHNLYKVHGFEPQYKKENGRKTNKLTADKTALLTLMKKHDDDLIYNILKWKHLEGIRKQLESETGPDGRMRGTYSPVGTETGRWSCSGAKDGTGTNLQTITKKIRDCYVADPDNYIFQIDLSGADGWTVAAHANRLGDSHMLEDYYTGVKPAKCIGAMYITGDTSLAYLPSTQLKPITNSIDFDGEWSWLYNACKAIQHGSSYGMGKIQMSNDILNKGWKYSGIINYVAPKDCIFLQDLFFKRYPGVKKWQSWVKSQLMQYGKLSCASGHVREFFGRRTDNATLAAAYAQEPQANTTYATSLAAVRLAEDVDNRNSRGGYIIEPLHQVHDALVGQFPIEKEQWAVAKLKEYFDNTLTIAGQEIKIPYEGEYGKYWGDNSGGQI